MPLFGIMIHQDATTHEWVKGHHWNLILAQNDSDDNQKQEGNNLKTEAA